MISDVFAGTIGGIAVVIVGHPFDTTKTRLQTAPSGFYRNTIDCVRKTIQWEGTKGFYRGVYSPLAGQMFFRACSFATFYSTMEYLREGNQPLTPQKLFIAGATTGFMISFIESPIDLVKTKLQVQIFHQQMNPNYVPKYTNVTDCVKYVRSHHGTQALWRGLSGTIIRNIPANALFFPVNEMTKRYFAQLNQCDVKDIPLSQKLMSGSCAGLSYWVCTYPLDVVKAKMQSNEGKPIGWLQTAKGIYQTGGLRAYSRGLLPCALRAIPACGTMFAIVDTVRGFLTN